MVKIFFNYADQKDDTAIMEDLYLFFSVLKDKIFLWHKAKILPGDDIKDALNKNLDDSDATVHLLSNSYENEAGCKEILNRSIQQNKKNIPVLLSTFPWELDEKLVQLKKDFLPPDHVPIDLQPNKKVTYTQIVRSVNKDLLGNHAEVSFNDRWFYFLLSAVALLAGFFAAYWANNIFGSLAVVLLVFLLFVLTALFILRKVIFPTSVLTNKF